jgi:hypothetical protein
MVYHPTQKDVPAFISPLTHEQHAQIGRIAVLWGQIDMFVDSLLTFVLGIEAELRFNLFADKQIGAKLDLLRKYCRSENTNANRNQVRLFLGAVDDVKAERNQCFHGVWGFRVGKNQTISAAAQHHKQPEKPFDANSLSKLERKLCRASYEGALALSMYEVAMPLDGAQPLFHGASDGFVDEEWFQEWQKRFYEDRHIPDHRWQPGWLPFLEHPLE